MRFVIQIERIVICPVRACPAVMPRSSQKTRVSPGFSSRNRLRQPTRFSRHSCHRTRSSRRDDFIRNSFSLASTFRARCIPSRIIRRSLIYNDLWYLANASIKSTIMCNYWRLCKVLSAIWNLQRLGTLMKDMILTTKFPLAFFL